MNFENDYYRLDIDPQNGSVRGLADKVAGLELVAEPRLAENFRLLLPLPDLEANYILEDNYHIKNALLKLGLDRIKTYRVYEKELRALPLSDL